jgi:hypothetical protein
MDKTATRFLEYTFLHVVVWVGLWGIISLGIDHYCRSFWSRLLSYVVLTLIGVSLIWARDHMD